MKPSFSPDRVVTKAESLLMKRTPLAVISFANNDKSSTTKTGESTILCKRIDNSAHFVDINQQAQPKKFTPLAIPLEAMKRKNLQQANPLHARVSVTEPAEYIPHHHPLDTHPSHPLHTETSESSRIKNSRNIPKERASASLKSRSKGKQKETLDKKDSTSRTQTSKPRAQIKELLKSSQKAEKKTGEDAKDIKRKSPQKMGRGTVAHSENVPPEMTATQKVAHKVIKQAAGNKLPVKQKVNKVSNERKSVKSNTRGREPRTHEKVIERSPGRDTTELDKFVQYNAMKIMEKMREQKMQDEFERRLNEERKIALNEGNRRIREANFQRFNVTAKSRSKPKAAWGAGGPKLERGPRSSSSTHKRPKPKIDDEERRKVLGLDHLDEEQLARLRQREMMKQELLDRSEEHVKPKRKLNEEEHEDIQRYMVEKKIRMEEEMRNKRREDYEDFEKKRRNLEHLFMEIRETREQEAKHKKKTKKRVKRRKTHKEEPSGMRGQRTATEPNYQGPNDVDYSQLYDQYRQIIDSKTSPKEENQRDSSNERRTTTRKKKKVIPAEQIEREYLEQKKKEYKEKYLELSDRLQRNLAHHVPEEHHKPPKKDKKGAQKGKHGPQNERNEAQKIIMEMDTDNFSEIDYSQGMNSEDPNRRAARIESEPDESGIPDNSAREIIEAAAIFIQKNYRGYRTRKILIEYIQQLNELYQNEMEQGYDEVEPGEYSEDAKHSDDDQRGHMHPEGKYVDYGHHEEGHGYEGQDVDDDEEVYEEEEEGEIRGGENCELADDEKHSLRSLLEKQKLELHDDYRNESDQHREAESSQNLDDGRHVAHDKYLKMAEPQYNMFYGKDDIELDENGEVIRTEDYSNLDQDQVEPGEEMPLDHEDQPYYALPYPRRTRSDGELIENYQFSLRDEESEESVDQISLHNDGEEDYEALIDKGKKFMLDKGGNQNKYFEGIMRDSHPSGSSRQEKGEESQAHEEEENQGDQVESEEYQEHEHYDPRFQKGYLQGYGNMRFGGDYEGHEDEEGYIHESDYEAGYGPEEDAGAPLARVKQAKAKSLEYKNNYSEPEGEEEDESEQEEGHENKGVTPEQDELEQEHEEEHAEYLSQQQINRQGENMAENEKMVMISTINSEEEVDGGMHFADPAGSQQFRNYPQRRIKSDIITGRVEPDSHTQSQRDTEERKSQTTSQRDSNPTRLSQKDQVSSRYQVDGGSQDIIEDQDYEDRGQEGEEEGEGEEHVSVDMLDPNYKMDNTDSEHFREELIQELSHYNPNEKSEHQIHEEDRGITDREAELEEEKVEAHPPQRRSHSGSEKAQGTPHERLSEQKNREGTEAYHLELQKLKEEQAHKWEQMMSHLSLLTSHDELHLNKDLKSFLETLRKQSEINKQQLTEEIDPQELLEAQVLAAQQNENDDNEPNFFNNTQPSFPSAQKNMTQGLQDTRSILASNMPTSSGKKLDMVSPLQDKYGKKKKPFGFAKKTNLQIDINAANEEANGATPAEQQGPLNLDLSQMRLVLGSEQLLREQSARTLSQSVSAPSDVDSVDLQAAENAEATSIFERDPFKEFTRRKFKELMQHENMKNLIKMREQALEIRHKTQLDHMKKMLENRRFSPRTFQNKQIELEKWVTKERDLIQKTKRDIERGWLSTADSLQRTQRDLMFLQKLGTHTDGRNTNTSGDISLRHSFTDEDGVENIETQSERLSKRSFLNTGGAEIRSPSSSKNIKIIDKFELKDTLYSPQVNAPTTGKKENLEEVKEDAGAKESEQRKYNIGEALGSGRKPKELEDSAKYDLEASGKSSQLSTEKKKDLREGHSEEEKDQLQESEEDNLQELPAEEMGPQDYYKPNKALHDSQKKESPRRLEQEEEDDGIHAEELGDEEIEWENEVLKSPLVPGDRGDRESTPGRTGISARKDMISPGGLGELMPSISSTYSPKSQEELRFMIQERMSNFKQMQEAASDEQGLKEIEIEDEDDELDQGLGSESHLPDNLQTKTDLMCWEILDDLFNELGEELSAPGKEHMWNKMAVLAEEPVAQPNLQNMIENNYFFHGGAEHVNFQANIPMPLSPSAEYIRLQQEKTASSLEMTPEQQSNQRYQDAQKELLKTLGIRTEVAAVTRYLELLIDEINGSYKENFLRNINTPLGFSTSEKLSNMRNYDLGASDSSSLAMSSSDSQLVLEIHLYFKVEERLMEEDPSKNEVSTELEHIHNKMIFDCVNEVLDSFRPFGVNGQPFPWKAGSKVLKCQAITDQNMEKVLDKVKMKVIDWASYLCGYYGEGDEFVIDKTQSFIDEYLSQVREERILRMLSEEIFELENKWITYDDEEAEVELEIADLVFDKMVTETAELIAQMYDKKHIGGQKIKVSNALNLNQNLSKLNPKAGFSDITKIDTDLNFNSV